jgi:UDP:flavonoid glycosyltransferase YjiC (YdhE family)
VIVPFLGDQFFWGNTIRELGAGSAPIPAKRLSAERLTNAITEVLTDPAIREKARTVGVQIRGEDGVGTACDAICGCLIGWSKPN